MNANIPLAAPVAVCGLGNIGSQVVPLLTGIAGVSHVILIDHDRYGASNIGHQRMAASNIGQKKVDVQKRVLRGLAPDISVETYACRIEAVPASRLRNCVILSCVDSRAARQAINRIAFRLGTPWIDSGLDRAGSVRARAYLPDHGDCLECNWSESDYELLEQRTPCNGGAIAAVATAAPMEYGAIAAGLQCALLRRVLSQEPAAEKAELAHQQWFLDVPSGRGWIGRYAERNTQCRFGHERWQVTGLARGARDITLGELLALAGSKAGNATITVEGQMFVRRVRCPQCRTVKSTGGRLSARSKAVVCPHCGGPMMSAAMDASDGLSRKNTRAAWLDRPLAAFNFVDGDIVTLHAGDTTVHYELKSTAREAL